MGATEGWQFVDTNILVYAYDRSAAEKHERAQQLMARLWRARSGCISVQVLQEFYAVAVRKSVFADMAQLNVIIEDLTHWQVYTPTARAMCFRRPCCINAIKSRFGMR